VISIVGLLLVGVVMSKAPGGPCKPRGQRLDPAALGRARGPLEGSAHDLLDPADIDELEGERPRAGGIDAGGAVAGGEPEQLLSLAQAGPGEGAAQEHGGELPDGRVENHKAAVALYTMFYNFGRINKTLRVTPAMEAGKAHHVWSLQEIANLAA
jgi:hypothetical protein